MTLPIVDDAVQFRREIGARLWAVRTFHKIGQAKFARSLGLNQSVYHKWESGSIFPRELKMRDFCNLYRVDFNYIYGGIYDNMPEQMAVRLHDLILFKISQM